MLVQLSIRDIVLIERLDITFETGLSVLTGETGAGKSILLDCLALALGGRADATLVRQGVTQGEVRAVFDLAADHPLRALLCDNGLSDEGDIILRRLQLRDGRSRAFINDQPTSIALMREVGRFLVEIHGQHADRSLVDVNRHRGLLDAFGGLEAEVAQVKEYYRIWRDMERALEKHRDRVAEAAREADYLRASTLELEALSPQEHEEEELADRRATMMRSEKIATDINEVDEILAGQQSPVPILANLVRRLERKMTESQEIIEPIVQAIDLSLDALGQAQDAVQAAMRMIDFDPRELEQTEERLFALRAASRKYAVAVENLPQLRERFEAELAELDAGETTLAQMEIETTAALARYDEAALALSTKRIKAARQLEAMVMAELPALKLERAAFIIHMETDPTARGEEGIDRMEYFVRTNPGTNPGPMMKTASGGELSRFLLALKVALADRGSAPTLIFDEIDTGVGGAVADSIGQRLSRLSTRVQLLCVTHAPQVAARADVHFLITKSEDEQGGSVVTKIYRMKQDERQEEIARMLAGEEITKEARAAALSLMQTVESA